MTDAELDIIRTAIKGLVPRNMPPVGVHAHSDMFRLLARLDAVTAENAALRRELTGTLDVLTNLSAYADAWCFCIHGHSVGLGGDGDCEAECRDQQKILADAGVEHPRVAGLIQPTK